MHPLHGFAVRPRRLEILGFVAALLSLAVSLLPHSASALPLFARQTGQNCVACHAGGQFPELTPYGRMFKLTGYTVGARTVPLSVMAVGTYAKLASTTDAANGTPHETYAKDGSAQATDTIAALKTGEAWIATGNLGTESRVKDQGGPDLNVFTPKEGTIGWMDSEMIVKGGANENLIMPFLEKAEQAEYIAANFILNGRPLFNEAAYKILINQGQQERADRFLYNKPETVQTMDLKGPGTSTQAVIDAFNEVFGA